MRVMPSFAAYPMSQPRQSGKAMPSPATATGSAPYFGQRTGNLGGIVLGSLNGPENIRNLVITVPRPADDKEEQGGVPGENKLYYQMNNAGSVSNLIPCSRGPNRQQLYLYAVNRPNVKLEDGYITPDNTVIKFSTKTITLDAINNQKATRTAYTISVYPNGAPNGEPRVEFSSTNPQNMADVYTLFQNYRFEGQLPDWIVNPAYHTATAASFA